MKRSLGCGGGIDRAFTCAFNEDDFDEMMGELDGEPSAFLVAPGRHLEVHSNNLRELHSLSNNLQDEEHEEEQFRLGEMTLNKGETLGNEPCLKVKSVKRINSAMCDNPVS